MGSADYLMKCPQVSADCRLCELCLSIEKTWLRAVAGDEPPGADGLWKNMITSYLALTS